MQMVTFSALLVVINTTEQMKQKQGLSGSNLNASKERTIKFIH